MVQEVSQSVSQEEIVLFELVSSVCGPYLQALGAARQQRPLLLPAPRRVPRRLLRLPRRLPRRRHAAPQPRDVGEVALFLQLGHPTARRAA